MAYYILLTAIVATLAGFTTYYIKKGRKPQVQANYHDLNFIPIMEKEEYISLYDALCSNIMLDSESINEIIDLDVNEYVSLFKFSESNEDDVHFEGEKIKVVKN